MVGGCRALSPFRGALAGPHRVYPALTARELDVLRWTADGKTSEEVAILLGVSCNTVNYHVKNAIRKLHVTNKAAAVARMLRLRLLM